MVGHMISEYAEESAEVEVLFALAKKHEEIGKKLKASVARLEESGGILQEAIGPVYSNTQPLQTVTANADRMLAVIEKLQKPLEGKADEEKIIRNGPAKAGLQGYLASLGRVESKLSQIRSTNLRVNQDAVSELEQLSNYGKRRLLDSYESIIQEDDKAIEPLHYITKDIPFPILPEEKASELRNLTTAISANPSSNATYSRETSPTIRIYADIRGNYLSSSLQNLAAATISTSKKKSPDETYCQGTSGIGTYASGIEGGFVAEWQNITNIFPRDEVVIAFEATVRKALSEFGRTLRELNNQIRAHITTECFLAYEIVDIGNRLAFRIDQQTGQLRQQLVDAVKPVRDTAKASLADLLDDIKRQISSMILFPLDGSAIPYTTEVMTRLQNIVNYPNPLASIMTSLGDGNWTSSRGPSTSTASLPSTKSFDVGADGSQLLVHYVLDTIETLLSTLEAKARIMMKSKALLGVFIANNVAVVDRMTRSSPIQSLLASTNSPQKLDGWRKKGTAAYLDAWREPCAALMDVQYTNRGTRPPSGNAGATDSAAVVKSLGSKDKDAIKEKFKAFNLSFEVLMTKHKEMMHGMERDVRTQLAKEVQAMIEPLYARFWDRYHEIDKGRGKYVRWDKGSLAAQLSAMG